jgi:UDP-3-O-[3-hydroxymyristoyl] glucosamine N-acyltransferase
MHLLSKKIKLSKIINFLNLKINLKKDCVIKNVSNIDNALKNDITLCLSSKYVELLKKTKASACIISKNFLNHVPKIVFQ